MSGGHDHEHGLWDRIRHAITPHSHDTAVAVDHALESSDRGPRALLVSLAVLGVTAALQAIIAALSGSIALLGDTLHNAADALTAVPLGLAFWVGRRAAATPTDTVARRTSPASSSSSSSPRPVPWLLTNRYDA
jgi:Co/Zn/Cd efflux system component